MAEWNGVPLNKAIIVRHEPRGAERASGGNSSRAVDYISREGKHGDQGEILREPTARDLELMRSERDDSARAALDYISREGGFADKGAGRQVDATLWGERGPVSRAEVERSLDAAGCFMSSIVTVDRRYADALNLSTKEDFQRLLRATWRESAERWGLFEHEGDIDWVAAYHTDAANSLHVHVYTWGRSGDVQPGDTVSREGTRAGKEVVYREGYADIKRERDERRNFLRDLSRQNILRQLGGRVDGERVEKLHALAEERGWPERVPDAPDWGADDSPTVVRLREKLDSRLAAGEGRLSKDYQARAVARDLIRAMEKASPSMREIKAGITHCDDVQADLKGYTSDAYKDRQKVIRKGREDYLSRLVPSAERALLGEERWRERGGVEHREGDSGRRAPREVLAGRSGRSGGLLAALSGLGGGGGSKGRLPGRRTRKRRGYSRDFEQDRSAGGYGGR